MERGSGQKVLLERVRDTHGLDQPIVDNPILAVRTIYTHACEAWSEHEAQIVQRAATLVAIGRWGIFDAMGLDQGRVL